MDPTAILGGFQTALGLSQSIAGGLGFLGDDRPQYETPNSVYANLQLAKLRAQSGAPGFNQAMDQNSLTANNAIRAAQQGGSGTAAIAGIQGQHNRANQSAIVQNQRHRDDQFDKYQSQIDKLKDYEDRMFFMNEFAPHAQSQQRNADAFGAGLQNIFGGLDIYGKQAIGQGGQASYFANKAQMNKRNNALSPSVGSIQQGFQDQSNLINSGYFPYLNF